VRKIAEKCGAIEILLSHLTVIIGI